jgi:hypothetical protein
MLVTLRPRCWLVPSTDARIFCVCASRGERLPPQTQVALFQRGHDVLRAASAARQYLHT